MLVLLAELLQFRALPAKRAHDAHASQILLHDGRERALGLVAFRVARGRLLEKQRRIQHDARHKRHRDERHPHIHRQHGRHVDGDQKDRADQLNHLIHDERADDLNVRRAALDDVARRVLHMPAVGQTLNVAVERVAQRLDKPLRADRQARVLRKAGGKLRQRRQRRQTTCQREQSAHIQPGQRRGQRLRFPHQHGIHREADDLREQRAQQRSRQHSRQSKHKRGRGRTQMMRQQPRLLFEILFHISFPSSDARFPLSARQMYRIVSSGETAA